MVFLNPGTLLNNQLKTNVVIRGYSHFTCQSHSQNGGTALYVKTGLSPTLRPDLGKDSPEFEAVWEEIENRNSKNYLICCLYPHPSSDLDKFNDY